MEDIYIGTPNAKQDEFLRCKKKYVAFGGARGGGKSWAVRCKAKLLAMAKIAEKHQRKPFKNLSGRRIHPMRFAPKRRERPRKAERPTPRMPAILSASRT